MSMFDFIFFFKQKTAYEMRISDWSSDVCSSDLQCQIQRRGQLWKTHGNGQVMATRPKGAGYKSRFDFRPHTDSDEPTTGTLKELLAEINYEYRPATGTEIKLDGLGGTLKFISRFTHYAFNSVNRKLPRQADRTSTRLNYS